MASDISSLSFAGNRWELVVISTYFTAFFACAIIFRSRIRIISPLLLLMIVAVILSIASTSIIITTTPISTSVTREVVLLLGKIFGLLSSSSITNNTFFVYRLTWFSCQQVEHFEKQSYQIFGRNSGEIAILLCYFSKWCQ